jgi:hypothetical protein
MHIVNKGGSRRESLYRSTLSINEGLDYARPDKTTAVNSGGSRLEGPPLRLLLSIKEGLVGNARRYARPDKTTNVSSNELGRRAV